MKKYHDYHTNNNWRKCLVCVNQAETGISTSMVGLRTGFGREKAYGFLYALKNKGLVIRKNSAWYPVPLQD